MGSVSANPLPPKRQLSSSVTTDSPFTGSLCYLQEMRVSEWASDLFPSALTVMAWITLMASTPTPHKVLGLKASLVSSDLFKGIWATQAQKDPQLPVRSQSYFKNLRASLYIDDTDTETFRRDCRQSQKPKTSGWDFGSKCSSTTFWWKLGQGHSLLWAPISSPLKWIPATQRYYENWVRKC